MTETPRIQMPTLTGAIAPLPREREEDHRADTLPLWERGETPAGVRPGWGEATALDAADLVERCRGARFVCVALTRHAPEPLRAALAMLAQAARTRVYVCGVAALQNEPWFAALMASRPRTVLARLGVEPPADWVVVDGAHGTLFVGAPDRAPRWALPVDADTGRSLHGAFTWCFWHGATLEYAPGALARSPLAPASADPMTAGVLALPRGALHAKDTPPLLDWPEHVVSPGGSSWPGTPSVVLTPPDRTPFARLRDEHAAGRKVVWTDLDLPRLAVAQGRAAMLLEAGGPKLRLELPTGQAVALSHLLDDVARRPTWRFHLARSLGDVAGEVWLEGARAPVTVADRLEVDHGTLEAPDLDTMPALEPTVRAAAPGLSRTLVHRWRVTPPRPHRNARTAGLLAAWKAVDDYVRSQVQSLRDQLAQMEKQEKSGGLKGLWDALIGRANEVRAARRRIADALDEINEVPVSQRPAEASAQVERLKAQHAALRALLDDAADALQDEARRQEEGRQRQAFDAERAERQARVAQLEGELAALRAEVARLEAEEEAQALAVEAAEAEHGEAQVAARREREATAAPRRAEAQAAVEDAERAFREAELRAANLGGKQRKRAQADLRPLQSKLESARRALRTIDDAIEAPLPPPESLKTLRDARDAAQRTRRARQTAAGKIEAALATARREAARPFVFDDTAVPSVTRSTLPALPTPPSLPAEHPPAVGTLLEHGVLRFLAITAWEQLDRARPEAKRLNARLVAGPET